MDTLLSTPAAVLSDPRLHYSAYFYVGDKPAYDDTALGKIADAWLRVGVYQSHGGVFFCDQSGRAGQDWAWAALAPEPRQDTPTVYFDQDAETTFPPQAVMPLNQLRAVVLEWLETGEQPRSVQWMPINGLVWRVTEDGQAIVPPVRRRGQAPSG
ncbi:MAG: Imm1 family immunity protein [Sciscionella sp.]